MEEQSTPLMKPPAGSRLFLFYFLLTYVVLYTFPFPLSTILFFVGPTYLFALWDPLVIWTGKYIIHLDHDITIRPNGSGDTTWNYVLVLVMFLLAVIGATAGVLADRKGYYYSKLGYGLNVLVRYYLGSVMIGYGFFKVIQTQFPSPFIERLLTPYGESSPMGLLWTFMGYSTAYNFFTGSMEVIGGFLLYFRKTRLLGALICIGVMSNVAMMNFTYDVPVKLFSSHLLLMAIFLIVPDLGRLLNFFVLNRPVASESITPMSIKSKGYYPRLTGKIIFILLSTGVVVYMSLGHHNQLAKMIDIPLYGVYEVHMHRVNNDTLPPLVNDTRRWKRVFVSVKDKFTVEYMDSTRMTWTFVADTINRSMKIMYDDSSDMHRFQYEQRNKMYFLHGVHEEDSLFLTLRRREPNDFPLMNRGFRWVNEYPYNK